MYIFFWPSLKSCAENLATCLCSRDFSKWLCKVGNVDFHNLWLFFDLKSFHRPLSHHTSKTKDLPIFHSLIFPHISATTYFFYVNKQKIFRTKILKQPCYKLIAWTAIQNLELFKIFECIFCAFWKFLPPLPYLVFTKLPPQNWVKNKGFNLTKKGWSLQKFLPENVKSNRR